MGDVLIRKRVCKQCGRTFKQGHALEKYCSDECRMVHKKLTQNEYKRRCLRKMRLRAKVDDNQAEIVAALRAAGCSVTSLASIGKGCPDIVVGRAGVNYLMEIKDGKKPPSKRKLTKDEQAWHAAWNGYVAVVESVEDALRVVSGHAV